MDRYTINVEGFDIAIEMSSHAISRMNEREVGKYAVYGLILKLGEVLLDMKDGEEFAIVDKEMSSGVICSINTRDTDLVVDVITVLGDERIYISRGTKIYRLDY